MSNGVKEISDYLAGTSTLVSVTDHHVTVALPHGLSTPERGQRLLNLEKVLRAGVSPHLEVFLEPMRDRNQIRHFRGIKLTDKHDG